VWDCIALALLPKQYVEVSGHQSTTSGSSSGRPAARGKRSAATYRRSINKDGTTPSATRYDPISFTTLTLKSLVIRLLAVATGDDNMQPTHLLAAEQLFIDFLNGFIA
jgi:hypothetical protein